MRHSHLKMRFSFFFSPFIAAAFALASPATASIDCEALAAKAGEDAGIPEHLLPAIARAESGKSQGKLGVRAWPWTLNEEGKGQYFRTKAEALSHLKDAIRRGVKNIDVGCMQVNYRWHGGEFESVEQMLDPVHNTRYAARFLTQLRKNTNDWMTAATHYHSKTPRHAKRYGKVLKKIIAKVPGTLTIAQAQLADGVIQEAPKDNTQKARQFAFANFSNLGQTDTSRTIYETNLVPRGAIDMHLLTQPAHSASFKAQRSLQAHSKKIEYFRADFAKNQN